MDHSEVIVSEDLYWQWPRN